RGGLRLLQARRARHWQHCRAGHARGSPVSRPLAEGEQVLLIDTKKRRYLITLTAGKEFHSHSGLVAHDAIIGQPEGSSFRSSHGLSYPAIRPTLSTSSSRCPGAPRSSIPRTSARS